MKKLIAAIALLTFLWAPRAGAVTIVNCQLCTTSGTNNVCPKPTGLTVGQLLVAVLIDTNNAFSSIPAGWVNPSGGSAGICGQSTGNGPAFIYMFYKVASAGDVAASNYTFQWSANFPSAGGICAYDFVGYSSGNPIDGGNGNLTCNSNSFNPSTTVTATGVTTGSANSKVIISYDSSLQLGGSTITGPGGSTQRLTYSAAATNNFWMGDFTKVVAGATGNQSGSQTQNVQYNAILFPLLTGPAAAGSQNILWPFP